METIGAKIGKQTGKLSMRRTNLTQLFGASAFLMSSKRKMPLLLKALTVMPKNGLLEGAPISGYCWRDI
uniref:Uncharacterized protein n=1 Tax=Globodera rostochiensis TaxID=31243 RepID=A0A914HUA6_GLORO